VIRLLRISISLPLVGLLAFCLPAFGQKKKPVSDDEGMTLEVSTKQKKKKSDEDVTQTLPLPKEPPAAVEAETGRIFYQLTPMSAKGLLSAQTREALKALVKSNRGTCVKLRAFVAGSGDLRRIQEIASEVFTEKHLALPALSVVLVGALPLEGAQVLFESIGVDKKPVNPNGIAFVSGQAAPTVEQSLEKVKTALRGGGMEPGDAMRVTCFVSSLEQSHSTHSAMEAAFPGAVNDFMQMQRGPVTTAAECEAVARLRAPASPEVQFVNPLGLDPSPNYSQLVLVSAPKLVLSSTQLSFGGQEGDIKLAFDRLQKALATVNARFENVVASHIYLTSFAMADRVRTVRKGFYNAAHPPASTMLPFEGLPSLDATFGLDVVAVPDAAK
jgi:enamine deaminase RidA (YjgF/YER057c/UK114 family)